MTITDYRNFDLLITRSGDRYRAFVVEAPAGEASVIFGPPFTADELTRLSAGAATDLAGLGRQLFEAVFRDNVHALLAARARQSSWPSTAGQRRDAGRLAAIGQKQG